VCESACVGDGILQNLALGRLLLLLGQQRSAGGVLKHLADSLVRLG
jgi:hypothetical protein